MAIRDYGHVGKILPDVHYLKEKHYIRMIVFLILKTEQ